MQQLLITLPINGPFDPVRLGEHLRVTSFGLPYTISADHTVVRSLRFDETVVVAWARVRPANDGHELAVDASWVGTETPANAIKRRLPDIIAHIFGVGDPLRRCYQNLDLDPTLRTVVRRNHGLRLIRAPDLFETLFTVILGQQISVAAANAQRRKLLQYYSRPLQHGSHRVRLMPHPGMLADTRPETFREIGISRQKSRYLREAAAWAADGRLNNHLLSDLADPEAIDYLRAIPGVGRWTAEIALMRGLGRLDIFPADDIGLQKVVCSLYGLDTRPDARRLRDFSSRWNGWRSYAALYLWMEGLAGANRR